MADKTLASCYSDDGNPIKCYTCGCNAFTTEMRDFIDFGVGAHMPCEIEYFCSDCKVSVAYWAYGSFTDTGYHTEEQEKK